MLDDMDKKCEYLPVPRTAVKHQTKQTKMKNQITEQTLLIDAINALRCAGQDKFADHLSEKLEEIAKTPKIAIFVDGGIVQGVRSNISQYLEVEIVDVDNEPDKADDRWEEIQSELNFGNY